MTEGELIRFNRDLSIKLHNAVNNYNFTVREFVQWLLNVVDLDAYVQKLAHEVDSDLETWKEKRREDERKAEEEETSTDEELAESANDEAETIRDDFDRQDAQSIGM